VTKAATPEDRAHFAAIAAAEAAEEDERWLHADLRRRSPAQAGIYDLARYGNP
jgi:hypothetical protein